MTDRTIRTAELRHILCERRREMQDDVQSRLRDERSGRLVEVSDALEHSDADIQGSIDFALLQMRAETMGRIDEALVSLDAGHFGSCVECGHDIVERRLRALPFAVRCQACEERREQAQGRARQLADRRGSPALFPDMYRS